MKSDICIKRQKIKLQTDEEKVALDLNQWLNEIIADKLPAMYENIFHRSENQDDYLTIDAIKVDLGTLQLNDFKPQFLALVEEKIISILTRKFNENIENSRDADINSFVGLGTYSGVNPSDVFDAHSGIESPSSISFQTERISKSTSVLYLLEHGVYPWWYKTQEEETPFGIIAAFKKEEKKSFFVQFLARLIVLPKYLAKHAISRFVDGLDQSDLEIYIDYFSDLKAENRSNIDLILEQKQPVISLFNISEKSFFQSLLAFSLAAENQTFFIKSFFESLQEASGMLSVILKKRLEKAGLSQVFSGSVAKTSGEEIQPSQIENEKTKQQDKSNLIKQKVEEEIRPGKLNQDKTLQQKDSIYVENAGLTLLHPFITSYFLELGLLNENKQFISIKKQQKAAVMLYHLQGGNKIYGEWEMPLNKILAGLQPFEFIPGGVKLNKKEIEESKKLLDTVVKYWTALKGSSVEAMQQTFFMRKGKISQKESAWLIQVERSGVDVLLDKLPWSIGTIKLPWLDELIHVEW